jgi:hypothetical protein
MFGGAAVAVAAVKTPTAAIPAAPITDFIAFFMLDTPIITNCFPR